MRRHAQSIYIFQSGKLYFGVLEYNMYCRSDICIAAPKYVLLLQNKYFHSEICIATAKYILPLRNMYCHSDKNWLPLRNNIGCSAIMHCHSEIFIAAPKQNSSHPEIVHTRPRQRTYKAQYIIDVRTPGHLHLYENFQTLLDVRTTTANRICLKRARFLESKLYNHLYKCMTCVDGTTHQGYRLYE